MCINVYSRDDEESNAILSPYHAFQAKYPVATAEAPRAARRRAGCAEDEAARDDVCIERLSDAFARALNIVAERGGYGTHTSQYTLS